VSAPAGATSATLPFNDILSGSYNAVALVDVAGGFGTTSLGPSAGDGVSDPSATTSVPASGQSSATLPIVYYLP
jgi:hypothetical protein